MVIATPMPTLLHGTFTYVFRKKKSLEQVSFPHVLIAYGPAPYAERDCIHIAHLLHFNSRFVNPKVLSA